MKHLLISVVMCAVAASAAVAEPTAAEQANALTAAGTNDFNSRKYDDAFAKFEQAYKLVPSATTAALACQAKLNADPMHPSAAVDWLKKWQTSAVKAPIDANGWRAVQRAHDALDQDVRDLEARVLQLQAQLAALKADFASSFASLKAFRNRLPTGDRIQFDEQITNLSVRAVEP